MYLWDILFMEAATRRHDRKGQVLLYIFLIGNVFEVINSTQSSEPVFCVIPQVALYTMFVCQMAFHAQISDPSIGGTYMTLLNTVANLGQYNITSHKIRATSFELQAT